MSVVRTFEGESKDGDLQEALKKALGQISADIGEDGVSDGSASWTIKQISGTYGGFAAFKTVKVKIIARRNPPWK
jgi:hypothetical protein